MIGIYQRGNPNPLRLAVRTHAVNTDRSDDAAVANRDVVRGKECRYVMLRINRVLNFGRLDNDHVHIEIYNTLEQTGPDLSTVAIQRNIAGLRTYKEDASTHEVGRLE